MTKEEFVAKVKDFFSPQLREKLYIIAAAAMPILVSFGVLSDEQAAQWTALAVAVITAVFALIFSESTWRKALYSVAAAAAVLFQGYGILADVQWAAILGLAAAVLGVTTAAAKAPTTPVVETTSEQ